MSEQRVDLSVTETANRCYYDGIYVSNNGGVMVGRIQFLEVMAYILLVVSIIGAIYIWSTMGTIEVPDRYGTETVTNPIGVSIGVAALIQGIIISGFLLVYCDMAKSLLIIKEKLNYEYPKGLTDKESQVEVVKKEYL